MLVRVVIVAGAWRGTRLAEPLKKQYGERIPRTIAASIVKVYPGFEADAFVEAALDGYDALELMDRARLIAKNLARFLPPDFEHAANIVVASLGSRPARTEGDGGMASFLYLPHTLFVAEHGLGHFEASMRAQHELTKRFTAEFSMRAFLAHDTEATLARLAQWTRDPDEHVRRLVSESTRPRLPWASRLRSFEADPRPVLALLEKLKDDPSPYVCRSVANNLNDIGKDHPELLLGTLRRWKKGATPQREWLIRHALRSAVKRGESGALELLGFAHEATVSIDAVEISPRRARVGDRLRIAFDLGNVGRSTQRVLADCRIHYIKASGKASPKVFKLRELELAPDEKVRLKKTVSLADMTTRRHHPGVHRIDALVNGRVVALGAFNLSRRGST